MIKTLKIFIEFMLLSVIAVDSIPLVSAEDSDSDFELTDDQRKTINLTSNSANFFQVEYSELPYKLTVNFERLSNNNEWEVEKIAEFEVNSDSILLGIDYDYPFKTSIVNNSDEFELNIENALPIYYPEELKDDNAN